MFLSLFLLQMDILIEGGLWCLMPLSTIVN